MKSVVTTLILGAGAGAVSSNDRIDDLSLAFRNSYSLENSNHLPKAIEHEFGSLGSKTQSMFTLACAPYDEDEALLALIGNHQHQPVYSSRSKDRVCYTVASDYALPQIGGDTDIQLTPIPHIMKIDDSVERIGTAAATSAKGSRVLELSMGLGVGGKGIKADMEETVQNIIDRVESFSRDDAELTAHFKEFYWTSVSAVEALSATHSRRLLEEKKYRYLGVSAADVTCDLSSIEVHLSRSHALMTFPKGQVEQLSPCFMLAASIAALSPHVSHIAAYEGYESLESSSVIYSSNTTHPTDQNAWLQSGNSKDTPYTNAGLDGSDYVLGIIDSGTIPS